MLFFLVHLPTAFLPPLFTAFWSLGFYTQCSLLLLAYTETWHSPKDTTSGRPRVGAARRSFLLLCLKAGRPSWLFSRLFSAAPKAFSASQPCPLCHQSYATHSVPDYHHLLTGFSWRGWWGGESFSLCLTQSVSEPRWSQSRRFQTPYFPCLVTVHSIDPGHNCFSNYDFLFQ